MNERNSTVQAVDPQKTRRYHLNSLVADFVRNDKPSAFIRLTDEDNGLEIFLEGMPKNERSHPEIYLDFSSSTVRVDSPLGYFPAKKLIKRFNDNSKIFSMSTTYQN